MISSFWLKDPGGYALHWERKVIWANWSGWKMWMPSVWDITSLNISDPNSIFSFTACVDSINLLFLQSLRVCYLISPMRYYEKGDNALRRLREIKAQRSSTHKSACLELKPKPLRCNDTRSLLSQEECSPEENVAGFTSIVSCLYKKRKIPLCLNFC